jgi:cation diffusion facilitator family transporter
MAEVKNPLGASRQVLLVMLWLTLLILAVKVGAGWSTGSLAVLAESLHTLIDGFSTVLSLIALSSPHRPVGREIGGHGRLETVLVLLLVGLLGFGCISLIALSVQQLGASSVLSAFPPVMVPRRVIGLLTVVWVGQMGMALFQHRLARMLQSSLLRLNARQVLQDAWLTVLLLMGLFGIWWGYSWLDPLMTIALVITAMMSCWRVLNWQLPLLVRQIAIAPEAIGQIVRQIQGVTHCYAVRSRGVVGRQVFVSMHLVLHPEFMGMKQRIVQQIEGSIRERYGPVQVKVVVDDESERMRQLEHVRSEPPGREVDWN